MSDALELELEEVAGHPMMDAEKQIQVFWKSTKHS